MCIFILIVVLLNAELNHATLHIIIEMDLNTSDISVNHTGVFKRRATDAQLWSFGLTKESSERGMRVELGKTPDGIFFRDPTTHGNLFQEYNWPVTEQVITMSKGGPQSYITNRHVVLHAKEITNYSDEPVQMRMDFSEELPTTVISVHRIDGKGRWTYEGFVYDINIHFTNDEKISYTNSWRDAATKEFRIKFEAGLDGPVTIKPGQSIVGVLSAFEMIYEIDVHYTSYLTGQVIAHYKHLYGKYHFYAPSVDDIMKAAKLRNNITGKETIEVRCYAYPKIEMFDAATNTTGPLQEFRPTRIVTPFKNRIQGTDNKSRKGLLGIRTIDDRGDRHGNKGGQGNKAKTL